MERVVDSAVLWIIQSVLYIGSGLLVLLCIIRKKSFNIN